MAPLCCKWKSKRLRPTHNYAAITAYLQSGMYPPDADKKEKRGLRKRAKYFVLFGGKLQYVGGLYISIVYNIIIAYNYNYAAIQILFVEEREHWVVSSFTNGKLRLYDSCSTGGLTSSLQVQL